ncbi:MAG: D-sedoheptulose 7-phosphate isomerase [Planctomycetota bacterium]
MVDVRRNLEEHAAVIAALESKVDVIEAAAAAVVKCLEDGGKVLWMGNGGSAADAQHMAAEIVGRFVKERPGLPSIALTVDTSILTAVGNDYGYDEVFARQVRALGDPGDVVVAISTSGNSPNVLKALEAARDLGMVSVGLTGEGGGKMVDAVDVLIDVPATMTARIQEAHLVIEHTICEAVDEAFAG